MVPILHYKIIGHILRVGIVGLMAMLLPIALPSGGSPAPQGREGDGAVHPLPYRAQPHHLPNICPRTYSSGVPIKPLSEASSAPWSLGNNERIPWDSSRAQQ